MAAGLFFGARAYFITLWLKSDETHLGLNQLVVDLLLKILRLLVEHFNRAIQLVDSVGGGFCVD